MAKLLGVGGAWSYIYVGDYMGFLNKSWREVVINEITGVLWG